MALTLLGILNEFDALLRENFDYYEEFGTPMLNTYPITPKISIDELAAIFEKFLDEHHDAKCLQGAPFALRFNHSYRGKQGVIRFQVQMTEDHPLFNFIHQGLLDLYSIDIGTARKSRCNHVGNTGKPPLMWNRLELDGAGIHRAPMNFDQSVEGFLKDVDRYFYFKYGDFYKGMCMLDDLQADFQPEENQQFADDMIMLCIDVANPRLGYVVDLLDANTRYDFMNAWRNNAPKTPTK